MWIKILCIENILWRILTTKSMFDFANMLKTDTLKDVSMNNYELLNIQACSFLMFWNGGCTQSLVVSCKYWVVPLISTRVSGYSQILPAKYGWVNAVGSWYSLQWRHNERDGVSNHRRLDCLPNRLFRQIKENIEAPCHWHLWGESTMIGGVPSQGAPLTENVAIWWRHHGLRCIITPCNTAMKNLGFGSDSTMNVE